MDLQQLPEVCIANIVSLTTPEDACRLSLLCKIFNSAAESDAVWDRFIPPETPEILSECGESGLLAAKSKKELYIALCNKRFLIDDGKLSFSLDKRSGKKCYMISARELGIIWGDAPRYWTWTSHPESRFQEVAELLDVCWLEINGKLETRVLSPSTLYKAYLSFKFTPGAYGFAHLPVEVTIGLEGGEHSKQTVLFPNEGEMDYSEEEMDYSEVEMDFSEGESDDAEGESDDSKGLSEDAEGESKDTKGESEDSKGLSEDAEGESKDSKGLSEDAEGESKDSKGLSEDAEGESKDTEGESEDAEGESDDSKGLSEDAEGESKDTIGESDGAKGETCDAEVPKVVFNDDGYQREDRYQKERSGWSEMELCDRSQWDRYQRERSGWSEMELCDRSQWDQYQREDRYQMERPGWLEIELGEFFCEGGEDGLLKMRCLAGDGHWKSGLIVQGIEVRPMKKY